MTDVGNDMSDSKRNLTGLSFIYTHNYLPGVYDEFASVKVDKAFSTGQFDTNTFLQLCICSVK